MVDHLNIRANDHEMNVHHKSGTSALPPLHGYVPLNVAIESLLNFVLDQSLLLNEVSPPLVSPQQS